jgi:hypothetical protein
VGCVISSIEMYGEVVTNDARKKELEIDIKRTIRMEGSKLEELRKFCWICLREI